jgi:hypothetical protein
MTTKDLFGGSTITDSSKKIYLSNLKRLTDDNKPPTNLNFLKDTTKIIEKIEKIENPNTRRSYWIAVVSVLKDKKPLKKYYDVYHEKMMGINSVLNKESFKTEKTKAKQETIKMEDLLARQKELMSIVEEIQKKRKITDEQYNKLHDLVITSLYTLLPPRRNLDYSAMIVGEPTENKELNYYHNGKFYFNNYKTKGAYKQQIIDVPQELQNILKIWIKFKKGEDKHLLLNILTNTPYEAYAINRIIKKAFNNNNVGVSALRNVYLTDKYSDISKEMKKDVTSMGTSLTVASNVYIAEH